MAFTLIINLFCSFAFCMMCTSLVGASDGPLIMELNTKVKLNMMETHLEVFVMDNHLKESCALLHP